MAVSLVAQCYRLVSFSGACEIENEQSLTWTVLLHTWRIVLIHFKQERVTVPAKLSYDVSHHADI